MLYKSSCIGQENSEFNTMTRNYSPVKLESASFGWKLVQNNVTNSTFNTFERGGPLLAAVHDEASSFGRIKEGGSNIRNSGKQVTYSPRVEE
jgi:hypothetical protein